MNSTTTDDDGVASRPRDSTGAPGREDACVRSLARALDDLASGAFCRRAVQSAGRPIGATIIARNRVEDVIIAFESNRILWMDDE